MGPNQNGQWKFFAIFYIFAILIDSLFLVNGNAVDKKEYKIISTEYGAVRGNKLFTLLDEKPYYSFKGIPYARPPVNELRFKPPKPPISWDGTKDAFEFGNKCVQTSFLFRDISGNEDCLFLNVYVPDNFFNVKMPVMIFLHGGGYYSGTSDFYGPDFLINNNVIVVTVNYRLGPFGFLSLGTSEYSGNMGLKDQQAALKWINDNIDQFDGDTNRITVFGESAGASSIHFHTMSDVSQQYFNRAILQSGSALSSFAMNFKDDEQLDILYKLSNSTNLNELQDFILSVDSYQLLKDLPPMGCTIGTDSDLKKPCYFLWSPVIEVPNAEEPFITENPAKILSRTSSPHNIDMLFGHNSAEAYLWMPDVLFDPKLLNKFYETFTMDLFWNEPINYYENSKDFQNMLKEIRNFYFPNGIGTGSNSNESLIEYNQLFTDLLFTIGIDRSAKYEASNLMDNNIFFYRFSLDTDLNVIKKLTGTEDFPGAAHVDDAMYLFIIRDPFLYFNYTGLTPDSREAKAIRDVTKLWTNFAKYGTPTPNANPIIFTPFKTNENNYVDITNDGLIPGINSNGKRIKFWHNLAHKYENIFNEKNNDSTVKENKNAYNSP